MFLTILLHGDPRAPHQVRLGAALSARGHRVVVANAPEIVQRIRAEYGATCEEVSLARKGPLWWRVVRHWFTVRNIRPDVVLLNYIFMMHKRREGEVFAKERADFRVTVDAFEAPYREAIANRRRSG